ncbi:MAG: hypothetical protein E7680_05430 [Ruminococcaceae bacterium]|nr:hypothetical protein [Oscillospiraceae bacterium]
MNKSEWNMIRRRAVALAYLEEKKKICQGKGSRDWSITEQDYILKLNLMPNFVAQFVSPEIDGNSGCVQFLECCMEYLPAHSGTYRNQKTGFFDVDNEVYLQKNCVPLVLLSDPQYQNTQESNRNLFAGQTNRFGVKVSASTASSNTPVSQNKERFGLKNTQPKDSDNSSQSDRKSKFGF